MSSPSTSFESVAPSPIPSTVRTPRGIPAATPPAPKSGGAMVVRVDNGTLAEALSLVSGLRSAVMVVVGGEVFFFWNGKLVGTAEVVKRLRGRLADRSEVVMTTAEQMAELLGQGVSVMEILLDPDGTLVG